MSIKVQLPDGSTIDPTAPPKSKTRKFTRPTIPEVEALFFRVAPKLTNREMQMLQWFLGRGGDSESVAQSFLNPLGQDLP